MAEAKKNGKFGYIRKGELVVEDRRPSRTKAAHRQEQNQTATEVTSGNEIANNHNHDDYPELQRPDQRYLRDPSPFSDATECDSDAATGRDSIGAVDQRRCHPDNRSRPTLGKRARNEEGLTEVAREQTEQRRATTQPTVAGVEVEAHPLKHVQRNQVK